MLDKFAAVAARQQRRDGATVERRQQGVDAAAAGGGTSAIQPHRLRPRRLRRLHIRLDAGAVAKPRLSLSLAPSHPAGFHRRICLDTAVAARGGAVATPVLPLC
jgi:hypothetical protein